MKVVKGCGRGCRTLWVMRTTWAFTLRKVGVTDGSEQRRDMD